MSLDISGFDSKPGTGSDEIYVCCPFCVKNIGKTDTGYHMGVNTLKGIYHCFRCGAKGVIKGAELEMLVPFDRQEELLELKKRTHGLFSGSFEDNISNYDLDEISWPLSRDTPIAFEYVKQRGYSDQEIEKYQIRVGKPFYDKVLGRENNKWVGRILFPYFFEGRCVYVVGRSYGNKEPRYLNSIGPKSLVVYGINNIRGQECILCEGIISSHTAARVTGKSAVCTLGKSFTKMQLSLLRARCNRVWLSYDADVEEMDRREMIRQLFAAGFEVWDVRLPLITDAGGRKRKKDPDDFGQEYIEYFNRARRVVV